MPESGNACLGSCSGRYSGDRTSSEYPVPTRLRQLNDVILLLALPQHEQPSLDRFRTS